MNQTDPDEPPKDEENSGEWNEWRLGQETEFRFEVDFDKTVFVKVSWAKRKWNRVLIGYHCWKLEQLGTSGREESNVGTPRIETRQFSLRRKRLQFYSTLKLPNTLSFRRSYTTSFHTADVGDSRDLWSRNPRQPRARVLGPETRHLYLPRLQHCRPWQTYSGICCGRDTDGELSQCSFGTAATKRGSCSFERIWTEGEFLSLSHQTGLPSVLSSHLATFSFKVMIVGPSDVGKTTLATLLLNYAVRSDAVPLLTDLDTNEGTITLPGCLAAAPVTKVIDPEDGYGAPAATTSLAPVSLYYGQASPLDRQRVYNRQVKVLGGIVQRKLEADQDGVLEGDWRCVVSPPDSLLPTQYEVRA